MNRNLFSFLILSLLIIVLLMPFSIFAKNKSDPSSALSGLAKLRDYSSKRISSFDKTGQNLDRITFEPGEIKTIAEIKGAGIIKHIWITIACDDKMIRRNAILRMFWDGETSPSVESPIGDFFGNGWGEEYNFISLPLAVAPRAGKALNCYFPMPFSKGAKITVENQSNKQIQAFYYYIDYEDHKSIPADLGRFHAWWNRELTEPLPEGENELDVLGKRSPNTDGLGNYIFADIKGKGHFVGINYYVESPTPMWYGEGDDMFFIDGESWPPSIHGTGTEDFFNTAWGPKEIYMHPYFGYARVIDKNTQVQERDGSIVPPKWMGRTHCYNFFVEFPIVFKKSCKATIEHGHNNCLTLDLCTVAYWYQVEPHDPFPPIPSKEKRQNMPNIDFRDMHRWRDAWRREMGGGILWGNEKSDEN